MKKRLILWLGFFVFVGLLSTIIYPAGRNPEAIRMIKDYQALEIIGKALNDYAHRNGRYPEELSALKNMDIIEPREKLLPYLDQSQTLYSRPDTPTPPGNFILLVRPFQNGAIIVSADGTVKLIKKQN